MKFEQITIAELDLDPANVRKHDQKNLDAIKASLKRFGQQKPIVVDNKGIVIAGNGTLTAARALGWEQIGIVRTGLEGSEATAYAIADNRTAELAEWDVDALMQQLSALDLEDPALVDAAGYSKEELDEMIDSLLPEEAKAGLTDPDEMPEEVPTRSTPGDVWVLGEHRLVCGDATNPEHLKLLMGDSKADLWLTDPPYNINYEGGTGLKIENDNMDDSDFRDFLVESYRTADQFLRPGAVFYVWHAGAEGFAFCGAAHHAGWKIRQCLIWHKSSLVMGRQDYQWIHEHCLYGWTDGAAHIWNSDRKQTTVLQFDKPKRNGEHPTMKPVEMFAYQISNSCNRGDTVLDSFGGSGTTIIACEQLGRKARLMELDPTYCDVIIKRWEDFTGQQAVKREPQEAAA